MNLSALSPFAERTFYAQAAPIEYLPYCRGGQIAPPPARRTGDGAVMDHRDTIGSEHAHELIRIPLEFTAIDVHENVETPDGIYRTAFDTREVAA